MAGRVARGGAGIVSRWQWPREAAQARKSLASQAEGSACSQWSMPACPQAASVMPQSRRLTEEADSGADAGAA